MDDEKIYQVLNIICESIKDCDINWRLDGSTNLIVQGMNLEARDLDIRTWKEDMEIFRNKLKKFIVKDYFNKNKNAFSIILNILGEEVEINHYPDWSGDDNITPALISWRGLDLKCLSLADAERFYRAIGRVGKADLIKEFIE